MFKKNFQVYTVTGENSLFQTYQIYGLRFSFMGAVVNTPVGLLPEINIYIYILSQRLILHGSTIL